MAAIGTRIYTFFFGELVGTDEFGTKYYRGLRKDGIHVGRPDKERRWVIYDGLAEPSKIPPQWHKWLHYMTDDAPEEGESSKAHDWQQDYIPNLTGTDYAYRPPGHAAKGGVRAKATGDYTPWDPSKE